MKAWRNWPRYEQLRAENVHEAFQDVLPNGADQLALDIGAGSGRDAAWLRRKGFNDLSEQRHTQIPAR